MKIQSSIGNSVYNALFTGKQYEFYPVSATGLLLILL